MGLDLILTVQNLAGCVDRVEVRGARSLTIDIDGKLLAQSSGQSGMPAEDDQSIYLEEGKASTQQLWTQLHALANELPAFSKLESFSLVVTVPGGNGFWIPRSLIASLLAALPQTCLSVEIDTGGSDYCKPGEIHLCDSIRAVLPHLHHLRLGLSTICHAMFGTGPAPGLQEGNDSQVSLYTPVSAEKLRTLLFDCTAGSIYWNSALCGSYSEDSIHFQLRNGQDTVPVVGRCMRLMLPQCPSIERMWIIDANQADDNDRTVYRTINRRDIIKDTLYCAPWHQVTMDRDSMLLRSVDGESISTVAIHRTKLEDGTWKSTLEGSRLPGPVLDEWELAADEPTILSADVWREMNPRKSCKVWYNERLTGQRVLKAVHDTGALKHVVVKERTPDGWGREEGGDLIVPLLPLDEWTDCRISI